jgi:hypothetical protein
MGVGDFHRQRRLAGMIAIVSALLYVALIPGHVVSQATSGSLGSVPVAHAGGEGVEDVGCHKMMGGAKDPAAPGVPATPKKKCPFCTGYASFLAALGAGPAVSILAVERAPPVFASFDAAVVESAVRRPQNRGPPLEL